MAAKSTTTKSASTVAAAYDDTAAKFAEFAEFLDKNKTSVRNLLHPQSALKSQRLLAEEQLATLIGDVDWYSDALDEAAAVYTAENSSRVKTAAAKPAAKAKATVKIDAPAAKPAAKPRISREDDKAPTKRPGRGSGGRVVANKAPTAAAVEAKAEGVTPAATDKVAVPA